MMEDNINKNESSCNENIKKDYFSKEDGWEDLIGSGAIKKRIIKEGFVESRPTKGDTICINAKCSLPDGTLVQDMQEMSFTLGDGEALNGLEIIVPLMDKGERCEVYMEHRFAYGEKGLEPVIPPNCDVCFEVELIDYNPECEPHLVEIEERQAVGHRKRERGNWWFNRGEYQQAIMCYKAAVEYLDDSSDTYGENLDPQVKELLDERLKVLNNMAAAQIKVEAYHVALKSLEAVLACQPLNVKALFRKGKLLGLQGKSSEGLKELQKAMQLEPDNRELQVEASRLQQKAREEKESERSLYKRMLGLSGWNVSSPPERHPTLRSFSLKLWAVTFIVMLCFMMAFKHSEYILQNTLKL